MRLALLFVFSLFVLISYINGRALIRYVELKKPQLFAELGSPRLTDSNLSRRWLKFVWFVWSFSFLKQNDRVLTRYCVFALSCEGIMLASVISMMFVT
jgi:hypothetical protein